MKCKCAPPKTLESRIASFAESSSYNVGQIGSKITSMHYDSFKTSWGCKMYCDFLCYMSKRV